MNMETIFTELLRTLLKEQLKEYAKDGKFLAVRRNHCVRNLKDIFGTNLIILPDLRNYSA